MDELLLGVDIGTYASKGVLCTATGRIVAAQELEHDLNVPRPGWAEQDADRVWWGDFVTLTRRLLTGRDAAAVRAVGVSAIGPCLLPLDEADRPLRPGILYGIDTRASAEVAELTAAIGEDALVDLCGMTLSSQAIGPKLCWLARHEPQVWARTRSVLTASSYLVLRLTGQRVMDPHTASHYNPLFDLAAAKWSDRFASLVAPPQWLPRLQWPTEQAGVVTAAAAAETGLRPGTPVATGTVDAAVEALSVGVRRPGDMMLMYGTTAFFILVTPGPVRTRGMWSTAYCLPGMYDLAAGMATTGALTRWFRDGFARDLGPDGYRALTAEAEATPPGAAGLVVLPYWSGERTPIQDPEARGVVAGLTLAHTRGHVYRALLEGTAYGIRHNLEAMADLGAVVRRVVAVGGGTRSPLWLQIVSDVTGVPQEVPAETIGASYGDAFLAGVSAGCVPGVEAIDTWARSGRTVEPRPDHHDRYQRYYEVYRAVYEEGRQQWHALARLGERDAPAGG